MIKAIRVTNSCLLHSFKRPADSMQPLRSSGLRPGTRERQRRPSGKVPGLDGEKRRTSSTHIGGFLFESVSDHKTSGNFERSEVGDDVGLSNHRPNNIASNEVSDRLAKSGKPLPGAAAAVAKMPASPR